MKYKFLYLLIPIFFFGYFGFVKADSYIMAGSGGVANASIDVGDFAGGYCVLGAYDGISNQNQNYMIRTNDFYFTSTGFLDEIVIGGGIASSTSGSGTVYIELLAGSGTSVLDYATTSIQNLINPLGVNAMSFYFLNNYEITNLAQAYQIRIRASQYDKFDVATVNPYNATSSRLRRNRNNAQGCDYEEQGSGLKFTIFGTSGSYSNGGSLSGKDSIEIRYPVDNSTTSAFFNNWILMLSMATTTYASSSSYYNVVVETYSSLSDLQTDPDFAKMYSNLAVNHAIINTDCSFYSCETGSQELKIPSDLNLIRNRTYYSIAKLFYRDSLGSNTFVAYSPYITFHTGVLTLEQTMYDPIYGYEGTSTDVMDTCTWSLSPANWVNCGIVGLQKFASFMIMPHELSLRPVNSAINNFKNVPPFKMMFDFNAMAQRYASSSVGTNDLKFISINANGSVAAISVLTSSSVISVLGSSGRNLWFEFQKYLAWAVVMFLAVFMVIKRNRSK